MESKLMWLIGALVCFVLVIQVVIPAAFTSAAAIDPQGTATGETWNGTASTVHTMSYTPIAAVTTFALATAADSATNTSDITGNGSTNTSTVETFTLLTPLDDGAVSGRTYNVTFDAIVLPGTNISLYYGTNYLGAATANGTQTISISAAYLAASTDLNFTFGSGDNISTVDNVTIHYSYFATNTNYSITDYAQGYITPTVTGTFYTSYTYGTATSTSVSAIMLLLPLVIAFVLLVLFLKSSGYF